MALAGPDPAPRGQNRRRYASPEHRGADQIRRKGNQLLPDLAASEAY